MTDEVWKREEIESPCQKICVIHPQARICIGCHRTSDEIAGWSRMSPQERREIMDGLEARGKSMSKRSGGRNARIKRGLGATGG